MRYVTKRRSLIRIERFSEYGFRGGFGITYSSGCTGTTYGEPGRNMFRKVTVFLGPIGIEFAYSWKDLS